MLMVFLATDLTKGTVANTNTVTTIVDNLHSQRVIDDAILAVCYAPASDLTSGEFFLL